VKSVILLRRECVACNHVYLSGGRSVGDIAALVGMCAPIVPLPIVFHGEVGGTKEAYGLSRGTESLFGSSSAVAIKRSPLCVRRGCQTGCVWGVWFRVPPRGVGGGQKSESVSYCESTLAPTSSV